jgi:hypothetical protein
MAPGDSPVKPNIDDGKPFPELEGDARSDLQTLIERWPRCFAFKFRKRRPLCLNPQSEPKNQEST